MKIPRILKALLPCFFLLLFGQGCTPAYNVNVDGVVRDIESKKPIRGARVSIWVSDAEGSRIPGSPRWRSVVTNSAGKFSFKKKIMHSGTAPTRVDYKIEKSGYTALHFQYNGEHLDSKHYTIQEISKNSFLNTYGMAKKNPSPITKNRGEK